MLGYMSGLKLIIVLQRYAIMVSISDQDITRLFSSRSHVCGAAMIGALHVQHI